MNKQLCMHCYISGKVQGVWFRASAQEEAKRLGINGWARNLADGRVEIFACGNQEQLEEFDKWLKNGPPLAEVTNYIREDLAWKDYRGFDTL
ncbi:acylphosphatase [Legionella clemsonensis]|uniref:Acylphosphatase n=1 Tax=Legionella clemsonensis TaxID=1867846 RepID=A0A222P1R5_9GAMM|nr:acylphosphatase [Legionella clemsonensis]ASQ45777.1 Acylphosphatase [Legionella clemsonensis]